MSKETKMKKNLLLTGLLSVLLVAGMMFTACPMESDDDDGGNGLPVPVPEDLPVLPAGPGYVSNETEAIALLQELRDVTSPARRDIRTVLQNNSTENGYAVKDDTSTSYLKINATESHAFKSQPDNFMRDDYDDPKVGDYMELSQDGNDTVEFTGEKSEGGVTVYRGSRIAEKLAAYYKVTLKRIDGENSGLVNFTASTDSSAVYGLTVSGSSGKGGKIILEAKTWASINQDITVSDNFTEPAVPVTYSGFLKVYGTGNAVVYTKNISNEADYNEVAAYF
jgi:hypothetical protein